MSTPSSCAAAAQPDAATGGKRGLSEVDLPLAAEEDAKCLKTKHDYSMCDKRAASDMDPPLTPERDAQRFKPDPRRYV